MSERLRETKRERERTRSTQEQVSRFALGYARLKQETCYIRIHESNGAARASPSEAHHPWSEACLIGDFVERLLLDRPVFVDSLRPRGLLCERERETERSCKSQREVEYTTKLTTKNMSSYSAIEK